MTRKFLAYMFALPSIGSTFFLMAQSPCTGEKAIELVQNEAGEWIEVHCNLTLSEKDETTIPAELYQFWLNRLNGYSSHGRTEASKATCYESLRFCTIEWIEPLPSGNRGYLSVVTNFQNKALTELKIYDDS